ncbi:MAG: hypothetical protein ACREJC_05980, partial [Tepidisphaeraceae bacterium]
MPSIMLAAYGDNTITAPVELRANFSAVAADSFAAGGVNFAGPISGSGLLSLRPTENEFTISGAGNTYSGGTIIRDATFRQKGVNVTLGSVLGTGNVTVESRGYLKLHSINSISSGKLIDIQSGGFVDFADGVPFNSALLSRISPNSSGVLAVSANPAPGLDLSGFVNLIIAGDGTTNISVPFEPSAGTYRLAAHDKHGTGVDSSAGPVLSGSNRLVVGSPGEFGGNLTLYGTNTYSGGTEITSGYVYPFTGALGSGNVLVTHGVLWTRAANVMSPSASLIIQNNATAYMYHSQEYAGGTTVSGRLFALADNCLGSGLVIVYWSMQTGQN